MIVRKLCSKLWQAQSGAVRNGQQGRLNLYRLGDEKLRPRYQSPHRLVHDHDLRIPGLPFLSPSLLRHAPSLRECEAQSGHQILR